MDEKRFLAKFLVFSGWLEIVIAVGFFFMEPVLAGLGEVTKGFFNMMLSVELIVLGSLLAYSARDIPRFVIIILASCLFRYAMAPVEILGSTSIPIFAPMFIGGMIYDIFSASLTLLLLKRSGFLPISQTSRQINS